MLSQLFQILNYIISLIAAIPGFLTWAATEWTRLPDLLWNSGVSLIDYARALVARGATPAALLTALGVFLPVSFQLLSTVLLFAYQALTYVVLSLDGLEFVVTGLAVLNQYVDLALVAEQLVSAASFVLAAKLAARLLDIAITWAANNGLLSAIL